MSILDGLNYYGEQTLQDIILYNVTTALKYGFLEIGAYLNIGLSETDPVGNDMSLLTPTSVAGATNYTIYKGRKADWVWEKNIVLKDNAVAQPIEISGIYVNSSFYATGSLVAGTGYHIDYTRGQVVFNNPLPSSYIVQCPHTIRWVNIYTDRSYEYRRLSYDWLNRTNGSGLSYNNEEKAFLPCIVCSIKSYDTLQGYELGSRAKIISCDFDFDILATNDYEKGKLTDICYLLETKTLPLFDVRSAPSPLNSYGQISGNITYPVLVSGYPLGFYARFREDAKVYNTKISRLPVKLSKVSIGLETVTNPY